MSVPEHVQELVAICAKAYTAEKEATEARKETELQQRKQRGEGEFARLFGMQVDAEIEEFSHPDPKNKDEFVDSKWVVFTVSDTVRLGYFADRKVRGEQRKRYFGAIEACSACSCFSAVARIDSRAALGRLVVEGLPEWECRLCQDAEIETGASFAADSYRQAALRAREAA